MENWKMMVGVITGTLVLVFGVSVLFSRQSEKEVALVSEELLVGEARHVRVGRSGEASGSGKMVGNASRAAEMESGGEVTIVEFSDFQCPACRATQSVIEKALEVGDKKVRLIYRHFPLPTIHKNAMLAAVASEVAGEQDKFFSYHDLLFARQSEWDEAEDVREKLVGYAGELGMDEQGFDESLDEERYMEVVNEDLRVARALGLLVTPSLFVEGRAVSANELVALVQGLSK